MITLSFKNSIIPAICYVHVSRTHIIAFTNSFSLDVKKLRSFVRATLKAQK